MVYWIVQTRREEALIGTVKTVSLHRRFCFLFLALRPLLIFCVSAFSRRVRAP